MPEGISRAPLRILDVTYGLPWPLTEGAKIRDYYLLRELAKSAEVTLLSFCKDDRNALHPAAMKRFCVDVETYIPPERSAWSALGSHWSAGRPLAALPFYFETFAQRITSLAERQRVDVVQIEHSFLAPYVTSVPGTCRKVLSLHNIGERQYASMAHLSGAGPLPALKALVMRGWEGEWAQRFDCCVTVSGSDAAWLKKQAPAVPVMVIDNGVDCEKFRPLTPASGSDLLFVGVLGYPPNADAVVQFATKALPLLRRRNPDVRFVVVGRNPRSDVRALSAAGSIELHEDVPDVLPFYQRARACVVPLRAGGGTRLKILEAMALSRPVISTAIGCEGLEVVHENQLLIADSADRMVSNIERILGDPSWSQELCARARAWVETRHDWRILGARLRELHRGLVASPAEIAR